MEILIDQSHMIPFVIWYFLMILMYVNLKEEEAYNYIVGLEKCETKDTNENVIITSGDSSSDNTTSDR